jgi:hypothetical protein
MNLPDANQPNWHYSTHTELKLSYILVDNSFTNVRSTFTDHLVNPHDLYNLNCPLEVTSSALLDRGTVN